MSTNAQDLSCAGTVRLKPSIVVNKEIAEEIGRNYRTLPIYEKGLFDHTYTKHYSLQTNEYLKCRWIKYKRTFEDRVIAPFQFIDIRDYHFYKCRNRLIPSESIHTKKEFRNKLKPGPGVDNFGQMPIPQELHMKRGGQTVQKKKSVDSKGGSHKKDGRKVQGIKEKK